MTQTSNINLHLININLLHMSTQLLGDVITLLHISNKKR
jgi:hypothetical protein